MIEQLFIITAVLMAGEVFETDMDTCMEYSRDFVTVIGMQQGVTQFTYKGFETELHTMSTADDATLASTEYMIAIGYGTPIDGCVPKE